MYISQVFHFSDLSPPKNLRQLNIGSAGENRVELGWDLSTTKNLSGYLITCGDKILNINDSTMNKSNFIGLSAGTLYNCSIVSLKTNFNNSAPATGVAQTGGLY